MKSINILGKELSPFAIRFIVYELFAILIAAILFRVLRDNASSFVACLREGIYRISLISMCLLGIQFFSALVKNRWRFKAADKAYPMLRAIILILLNAIACMLTSKGGRGYLILLFPVLVWVIQVIISTFYKWLHS